MRRNPRFTTHEQVVLEAKSRNQLRPVWMRDISKGGMFVETEEPPEVHAKVRVQIETPDGTLVLRGEVVHQMPPGPHSVGGVGIQFTNLTPGRRRAIEDYVDGLAEVLQEIRVTDDVPAIPTDEVARQLQVFLRGYEREDLYAALGTEPQASAATVRERLDLLKEAFSRDVERLPPALVTRIRHARSLLHKVHMLMTDEVRRIDYDFRHGHVFPEFRIAEATSDEALDRLREIWRRIHLDKVKDAEKSAAEAIRAVNRLDYDAAVTAGRAALVGDPFNTDLRTAVREWQVRLDRRAGPRPKKSA